MNQGGDTIGVPKTHPASRPVEPDDPMELHATAVPGEPLWMLQMLVEEYCRMGWNTTQILRLADDPFYQAFHGLKRLLGHERFYQAVQAAADRHGVFHATACEHDPTPPVELVELQLPGETNVPSHPKAPMDAPP
ncbi:MAG: hypothetical protein KatS3mg110_3046 [Pirellulaceae bacterium]|nr:MAG: hypothetical protein KatS3mg110_3046 [Pirellulaceae bacterium]